MMLPLGRARRAALLLGALGAALLTLTFAARAQAFIYWGSRVGSAIGRANLDGTGVERDFISGAGPLLGVAVDGTHVYWANWRSAGQPGTAVGRADLNGTAVNQSFITGADFPCGVAVDGAHVYWGNEATNTIGRANLNGSDVDQRFITGANRPCELAVDKTHLYWANTGGGTGTTIGRAKLDGTEVDQDFIGGTNGSGGVAVDGAHVYWANTGTEAQPGSTIGRAKLDGTDVDQSFIKGASFPCGVAVDDAHVYWGNVGTARIGRANLNGSVANQSFIAGVGAPCGIAVDSLSLPTCTHVATSAPHNTPVAVKLDCSGPGTFTYGTVSQPTHGRITDLNPVTGTLTYTPNSGFTGADSFAYRASNAGGSSNIATVTITVHPPAPTCRDVSVSTRHGKAAMVKLACTGEGKLTYAIVSRPAHGELSELDPAAGTLKHKPSSRFSGTDGFIYQAANAGGASAPARVTITVGHPSNRFRFARVKRNRRHGTATLGVVVPGAGVVRLARTRRVRPQRKRVGSAGRVKLRIRPRGKARRHLHHPRRRAHKRTHRRRTVKVRAKVIYTPRGGESRTKRKAVRLKLRRRARRHASTAQLPGRKLDAWGGHGIEEP